MSVAGVIAAFLATIWLDVVALRRIDFHRLQFIDGVLLGLNYYILIPFSVILMYGRIGPDFLPVRDYLPYEDLGTTTVIIVGSLAVCLAKLIAGLIAGGPNGLSERTTRTRQGAAARAASLLYMRRLVLVLVLLDIGCALAFFLASGVASGGHWYHASSDLMAESSTFLLLKHVGNFARTAVFGAIAVLATVQSRSRWPLLGLSALLALMDLFLTFNRITVVYFLVVVLVVLSRHIYAAVIGIIALLFSGTYLSTIWPAFRSQVSYYGYSVDGLTAAMAKAIEVVDTSRPFVDQMNGMFESVSFSVLNFIVQQQGSFTASPVSFFIRPVTVFIPRSIYPDRPSAFAVEVGSRFSQTELPLNSYLFGESYASSWLFWPILLLLLVAFFDVAFRRMARTNVSWGGIGALIGFAWWRFDSSIAMVSLVFSVALYTAFLFLPADAAVPNRPPSRRPLRLTDQRDLAAR